MGFSIFLNFGIWNCVCDVENHALMANNEIWLSYSLKKNIRINYRHMLLVFSLRVLHEWSHYTEEWRMIGRWEGGQIQVVVLEAEPE